MSESSLVRLVLPDVRELLAEAAPDDVRDALEKFHSADIAEVLEELEDEEAARLLLCLDGPLQAEVFEQLEEPQQVRLVERMGPEQVAPIVTAMASDDRVDLIGALPPEKTADVLSLLPSEERADIEGLVTYDEDTAGGIMTSEYVALDPDMTVREAIDHVRVVGAERETVYALYVVDKADALRGVVTMRQLILSDPGTPIREIMIAPPISMPVESDQESVVEQLGHYDFVAMPIIDAAGRMLGIVTHDDVLDVAQEEATEDAQLMGGLEPLDDTYLETGLLTLVRKRAVWLLVLFLAGIAAGGVLRAFEATLERTLALIFFLPLIIASGGNSGAQSATLVTRGLAVGDVDMSDWWRIVYRELASGMLLGALLGLCGLLTAVIMGLPDWQRVALTVGVTLIGVVTVGSLLGSLLPILLKRVSIDPAICSAPLVACLIDVIGILIYVVAAGSFIPAIPVP